MNKSRNWVIVIIAFLSLTSYSEAAEDKRPYSERALEHYNKAVRFHELGFGPQAIAEYKAAIAADGRMGEAWSNLGTIYYSQKQLDAASNSFQKAIQLNPKQAINYSYYAKVLDAQGKHEEAANARIHAQRLDLDDAITNPETKPTTESRTREVKQFLNGRAKTIHGIDIPEPKD